MGSGAFFHACRCRCGWAPVHRAALHGRIPFIEFLLSKGADVNAQDGFVPLLLMLSMMRILMMLVITRITIL